MSCTRLPIYLRVLFDEIFACLFVVLAIVRDNLDNHLLANFIDNELLNFLEYEFCMNTDVKYCMTRNRA